MKYLYLPVIIVMFWVPAHAASHDGDRYFYKKPSIEDLASNEHQPIFKTPAKSAAHSEHTTTPLSNSDYQTVYHEIEHSSKWFFLTPIIVLIGIILNLILFLVSISHKAKERKAELFDNFWFRTVFFPELRASIKKLSRKHIKWWKKRKNQIKLKDPNVNLAEYLDTKLESDTHKILIKLELVKNIDQQLAKDSTDKLLSHLELTSDRVAILCSEIDASTSPDDRKSLISKVISYFESLPFSGIIELISAHESFSSSLSPAQNTMDRRS